MSWRSIGLWLPAGAALGVALAMLTGFAAWYAWGPLAGVIVWTLLGEREHDDDDPEHKDSTP